LGSVLLLMVISLYMTGVSTGTKNLKISRLNADLHVLITLMERDLRRAGFGGDAYLVGATNIKSVNINSDQNCIVYYYNHNHSQLLESSNKMAFSLKNDTLKFKTNVSKVAETVCEDVSGWKSISDKGFIKITQLVFTEEITSHAQTTIVINLSGELIADSRYRHSISTSVQVRN
ncbi:MAG: pilus assembly protein PilW, partial [Psychromonas sp.]